MKRIAIVLLLTFSSLQTVYAGNVGLLATGGTVAGAGLFTLIGGAIAYSVCGKIATCPNPEYPDLVTNEIVYPCQKCYSQYDSYGNYIGDYCYITTCVDYQKACQSIYGAQIAPTWVRGHCFDQSVIAMSVGGAAMGVGLILTVVGGVMR